MSVDPLGVILNTRSSAGPPPPRSSSTRIDGRVRHSEPADLLAGPRNRPPSLPSRNGRPEGYAMDRDLAVFFTERPVSALPSLQRPKIDAMPETEETVKTLIATGRFRLAVRIARLLLDTTDPKETIVRGRLTAHVASCYFRLNDFNQARDVLKSFAGSPTEPFNLMLMRCELHHYLGQNDETIRSLHRLRDSIIKGDSKNNNTPTGEEFVGMTWRLCEMISNKIISYLVLGNKLQLALKLVSQTPTKPEEAKGGGEDEKSARSCSPSTFEQAMAYRSLRRAKILLKIGDLRSAREATEEYEKMVNELQLPTTALLEMRALLLIANSKFKDAMEILMPLVQMTGQKNGGGVASADVVNNFAVCALFTNQITLALDTMEMAVRADPFQCLNSGMVQNLVALYDLCSMKDRKALLRKLVDRYAADDVAEGCRRQNLW